MFKKFVTRFIIILTPLALVLTWLLVDKPGFYGDEVTHLTYLDHALNNVRSAESALSKITTLYIFNQAYPPFFYVLSLPFLKLFSDVIIGMRVYIGVIFIICYFIFYKLLRIHLSREAALSGCLFLCTSNLFVAAGRFYYIEILLLLETLAFYYFIVMNNKTKEKKYIFLASLALALGLLTKFNFVMYAGPIALFYYGTMLFQLRKGRGNSREILLNMLQLASFPLLISSPWYIYNIYAQGGFGALRAADYAYQIGIIQKNDTLKSFIDGLVAYFKISLPVVSIASLFVFAIILVVFKIREHNTNIVGEHLTTEDENNLQKKAAYLWTPLIFIILVSAYVNYMGMPQRWNLSYAFLAMLFALSSESLPLKAKLLLLPVSGMVFFAIIFNSYIFNLMPGPRTAYLLPNPLPAGPKEVVDLVIKDSENRYGEKFEGFMLGVIAAGGYHDVREIDYYAKKNNFNENWVIPSYWENPAGVDIFLKSDYLISAPENLVADSVSVRYKYILDHLPETYKACLSRVGTVKSKSGQLVVDNLDKNCLTSQSIFDLIEVGRKLDEHNPFEIFWELDAENAKLASEGKSISFSKYQQDYYNLLSKIDQEKEQLPPNYYSLLKTRLDEFYKNAHIVLDWGNNLLLNSSFEEETNGHVTGWIGNDFHKIKVLNNSSKSHTGNKAIRIINQATTLTQLVPINSQKIFLLKQYTMSNQPAQEASLQILWLDKDSKTIRADIVHYEATSTWAENKMILFPPLNSKYAIVYVTVVGKSSVWFDDVTLQEATENDK